MSWDRLSPQARRKRKGWQRQGPVRGQSRPRARAPCRHFLRASTLSLLYFLGRLRATGCPSHNPRSGERILQRSQRTRPAGKRAGSPRAMMNSRRRALPFRPFRRCTPPSNETAPLPWTARLSTRRTECSSCPNASRLSSLVRSLSSCFPLRYGRAIPVPSQRPPRRRSRS